MFKSVFETIKNESWFNETIFIITADHSSENFTKRYQSKDGRYEVPLMVFEPEKVSPKWSKILNSDTIDYCSSYVRYNEVSQKIIQHIDIIPLALERAGYKGKIFTLGSYFEPDQNEYAFQNEEGNYQLIYGNGILNFDGNRFKIIPKNFKEENPQFVPETLLKGKIQDYNYRMVNNKFW